MLFYLLSCSPLYGISEPDLATELINQKTTNLTLPFENMAGGYRSSQPWYVCKCKRWEIHSQPAEYFISNISLKGKVMVLLLRYHKTVLLPGKRIRWKSGNITLMVPEGKMNRLLCWVWAITKTQNPWLERTGVLDLHRCSQYVLELEQRIYGFKWKLFGGGEHSSK